MTRPYKPNGMPGLMPYIVSPNPEALGEFLAKSFGFEPDGEPLKENGKVTHLEMVTPDSRIMIGLEGAWGDKSQCPKSTGNTQGIGLYLYIPDVDKHHDHAKNAGAEIYRPLEDAFWGDRMYGAIDIDGNRWTFATNVADFDPSKIPS